MGVPKFYRWISERYPCLSEVVKEFQLPEFDNLYLDMNGIIHVCSHPDDDNPHFRITEEKIFTDICRYIDFLFRMIKPKKVFFMAVDGVAPRAKMNQQRGRRFRSAREAEELIEKAQKAGETLPTEKRFDSNCITPGTPFMVRLQDHLKYFVNDKISRDPQWQGLSIYLSGHETPGEGEHKVMDYIRWSKAQPDHDGNTRHCLYGLDADLIMLGLTSHEPNFSLLREEVRFGSKHDRSKRPVSAEETTFHLLHLSLMRDYLAYEFSAVKDKLPFKWDLERLIDDWILMGFLVGNDFIPHLPHFHIHHDALPILWQEYMNVLPTLGGYLHDGGYINLERLEKYFKELSKHDLTEFQNAFSDLKYLEGKLGGKSINLSAGAAAEKAKKAKGAKPPMFGPDDLAVLSQEDIEMEEDMASDESEEDEGTFEDEIALHKKDYYTQKLCLETVGPEQVQDLAEGYVRGLQWILLYYFEGVPSWSWYYHHHYSPFISDVHGFKDMEMNFELSTPFFPFQQLMAVLPAASKELLPPALQPLMTEPSSPVIHFYPVDFKSDLNGKQQSWEAVVLIPFIDEELLLSAMKTRESLMTREESGRNRHGPHFLYKYTSDNLGFYPSTLPGTCPDIHANRAECTKIEKTFFRIESRLLKKGLAANVDLNVYFPGFPTLRHIPHTHELKGIGVKVFQQNSRGRSVILHIDNKPEIKLEILADQILGKTIFVGWPHMHEARVTSIANEAFRIELHVEAGKNSAAVSFNRRDLGDLERATVASEADAIKQRHKDRFAIDVGKTEMVVYASPMTGRMYNYGNDGTITLDKQFASQPTPFVYQLTIKDLQVQEAAHTAFQTLDDVFPPDATVYMLGTPHYGAQGKVLEVLPESARVRIALEVPVEPDLQPLGILHMKDRYLTAMQASRMIGVSTSIVSRITGCVFVEKKNAKPNMHWNRVNIGLDLKFTKREMEVPGYTKKEPTGWTYSKKCVDVISLYINQFSNLWQRISSGQQSGTDVFNETDLFPESGTITLAEVNKFVNSLPSSKAPKMKFGCEVMDDVQVARVENMTANVVKKPVTVKMKIKPRLLFRPLMDMGSMVPDPHTNFLLYDRIVVVKAGYSVPFGKRGTIIGIPVEETGDLTPHSAYDVVFDEPFAGGITLRCSPGKGLKVPGSAMLNITYGEFRKNRPVSERPTAGVWNKERTNAIIANASNNNASIQPRTGGGGSHQALRWDSKRQPLFGQVFAGNDNPGGSASTTKPPEFVTPKVTAPQPVLASKGNPKTESVDFNSLWKNLQKEKDSKQSGSPIQDSAVSTTGNRPQAYQPSDHRSPSGAKHIPMAKQEPVKILTKPQTREGHSPLVQSLFANSAKLATSAAAPQATQVQAQAQAPKSTENAEFMAMFNSLKLQSEELQQQKAKAKNGQSKDGKVANGGAGMLTLEDIENTEKTTVKLEADAKTQDANNAIKQMLKIGSNPSTASVKSASPSLSPRPVQASSSPSALSSSVPPPPSASASYGKQVSLQELFDQANRQLKTQPKEEPKKENMQQMEKKDPVRELEAYCQANGLTPPSYEFRHPGKQTSFIANVLIHSRGRYEGSVCPDKMEAAQSAASIALLCLVNKPHQASVKPPFIPGAPRPGLIQPVFSQNSAFSPIRLNVQPPRVQGQGQMPLHSPQQPDLMRPPPLLTPRHFSTQLPPPSLHPPPHAANGGGQPQSNPMLEQLHRQLQHLATQFHQQQQQMQAIPPPSFQAVNANRHQAPPMHQPPPHHQQQQLQQLQQQQQHPQPQQHHQQMAPVVNQMAHQSAPNVAQPSPGPSQPFIPLQVTRNQKTPKSKKENDHNTGATPISGNGSGNEGTAHQAAASNNGSHETASSLPSQVLASTSQPNGLQRTQSNNAPKPTSQPSASAPTSAASASDASMKDKPAAQKKKSRLAANFSKMSPAGSSPALSKTK